MTTDMNHDDDESLERVWHQLKPHEKLLLKNNDCTTFSRITTLRRREPNAS